MNDETSQGDSLGGCQTFKTKTFLMFVDRLNVKLKKRITDYD